MGERETQEMGLVKSGPVTIEQMAERVQSIKDLMRVILKKDTHYGVIPGCRLPSLYKPGAEQINVLFNISVIQKKIEDLSGKDFIRYRITQEASDASGRVLGTATGECSSLEDKYRWRKPIGDEYKEVSKANKREVWKKDYGKPIKLKQVRTFDPSLNNTILMMADKRSYVAVTRKVTACSDIFAQDLEDLPPEYLTPNGQKKEPPKKEDKAFFTKTHIDNLKKRLKAAGMPEEDLLIMMGHESFAEIPKSKANEILDKIQEYTGGEEQC